jgi:1-deoxy-D-xylulose-5-phosphate reductoisomerase
MNKQWISILGSTGSIGQSTLDVVALHPERFGVFALTAYRQADVLMQQIRRFRPRMVVVVDEAAAAAVADRVKAEGLSTSVASGGAHLSAVASHPDVDIVMAAIVGAAGLFPCLAAASSGKKILLANKEALVVGGHFFMQAVRDGGATLLPIDSEHSAIFQSLPEDSNTWRDRVQKLILTASGGPFRNREPSSLRCVTPQEACAHPNWVMGRKISVDSATMMNKALEVIEAHHLFQLPAGQIEVVIHPQSVIHSMVQYKDASVVCQMGSPDMKVPIAYGLSWPDRMASGAAVLDFASMPALTFEKPDPHRYPCLQFAWTALAGPIGSTAVLNAANEIAVDAFLQGRLRFDQIYNLIEDVMLLMEHPSAGSLDAVVAMDVEARAKANQWVHTRSAG